MDKTKRQQKDNQDNSAATVTNQMTSITSRGKIGIYKHPAQAVTLEKVYRMTSQRWSACTADPHRKYLFSSWQDTLSNILLCKHRTNLPRIKTLNT